MKIKLNPFDAGTDIRRQNLCDVSSQSRTERIKKYNGHNLGMHMKKKI